MNSLNLYYNGKQLSWQQKGRNVLKSRHSLRLFSCQVEGFFFINLLMLQKAEKLQFKWFCVEAQEVSKSVNAAPHRNVSIRRRRYNCFTLTAVRYKLPSHLLGVHNFYIVFVTHADVHPRLLHAEHGELNPHLLPSRNLQHGGNWFTTKST